MLEGRKVLVIGSGISGIGAAVLLEKNHADVVLYDSSDKLTGEDLKAKLPEGSRAACIAGELPENVELSIQAAVLSPGVPTDIPLVNRMRDRGVQILGEIELGFLAEQGRVVVRIRLSWWVTSVIPILWKQIRLRRTVLLWERSVLSS